ncbi:MAG TPA: peptide ABC transporter substrate-binding protein [Candidatus Dormibacteraeota bacterium]|nr:peptide ABC transporter substrate-binding protein [Candidatus Dormibacteraeota bacterium]
MLRRIAVVALLLAFAGCTKITAEGTAAGGNPWTQPGVLRWAENQEPHSLNVLIDSSTVTNDVGSFAFQYTVRYDDKGNPVPDAVTRVPTVANGDVSKDGKTIVYRLRPDLRWSDGQPLTCEDLKFTWQAVLNPKNNVVTTDGYNDIKSITWTNPHVCVVHMKDLYAPFLQQLWSVNGNAPILPAHLLAKYPDINHVPYNSLPVTSGPYMFTKWQRGVEIELKPNPYWPGPKPKLKEIVFQTMPDENTMLAQLQAHEIDLLARGSQHQWPQLQHVAGVKAVAIPSYLFAHIDFNLERPILQDRDVRLAIAMAVNKREIIDKLLFGLADEAWTDQSPRLSWAYDPTLKHYTFDPAAANRLLEADGWKMGSDGVRHKDGRALRLTISGAAESAVGGQEETLIQADLKAIGVALTVKNYPTPVFFENDANGIIQGGKYDLALFSWSAAADPDDSAIYSCAYFSPHGQNNMHWCNKRATAAMDDALRTLDRARRKTDYRIVQEEMLKDVPTIILYFSRSVYAYNSDLRGFSPSPVISPFYDTERYSI